jgi:transposase
MTDSPAPLSIFVGIDVAKDKLDMGRSDAKIIVTFSNDEEGRRQLLDALHPLPLGAVVVEATGGWEQPLLHALLDAGLPVSLVNPGHVRHLAKGLGIAAKTDSIDARVLAEFGRLAAPRLARKRSKNQVELEALVTCRRQLIHVRTEQLNRRGTTRSKPALRAIEAVLKTLDRQIDDLQRQIRKLIESDDDFHSTDQLLRTVPGVGPVTSSTLLAELGELGQLQRRPLAALAGLAPFNRDSGLLKGRRAIGGGRAAVRSALYMATVTAIRSNRVIERFARRLQDQGKASKVVITACMHKLLSLLNAMVRHRIPWQELQVVKTIDN